MTYCGGSSIGTKEGKVHFLCLKEDRNWPFPKTTDEEFMVYKMPSQTTTRLDILKQADHPPIPIFWEPTVQERNRVLTGSQANGVMYIGHWTVTKVQDFHEPIMIMEKPRCSLIRFRFESFNEKWSEIIRCCHEMTCEEIRLVDFKGVEVNGPQKLCSMSKGYHAYSDEISGSFDSWVCSSCGNVVSTKHRCGQCMCWRDGKVRKTLANAPACSEDDHAKKSEPFYICSCFQLLHVMF